jgi:metal-responsive CopG/Arc/MetJ family transcriptional regulator
LGRLRSVNFRLEQELLAKVDEIAQQKNTSRGAVIRMAVEHYIRYIEQQQQQQEVGLLRRIWDRVRQVWVSLSLTVSRQTPRRWRY